MSKMSKKSKKSKMINETEISKIAHQIWINEGQPDGEQIIETIYGPMKLREKHWMEAKHKYIHNVDLEIGIEALRIQFKNLYLKHHIKPMSVEDFERLCAFNSHKSSNISPSYNLFVAPGQLDDAHKDPNWKEQNE